MGDPSESKTALDFLNEGLHLVDLHIGFVVDILDDTLYMFQGGGALTNLRFAG